MPVTQSPSAEARHPTMKLVFENASPGQISLPQGIKRIGAAADADVILHGHDDVLPLHCELHVGLQGLMLKIARGAAVTVNGRVAEGLIAVRAGDTISFGAVRAVVMADASEYSPPPIATFAANDDGMTVVRAALPKYALRAQSGRMMGRSYPVSGATVVGRTAECQIRLDESSLSRRHARLVPTGDGMIIEDLGSTNGSFHNGVRVQRAVARAGDEIGFDTLRFKLVELGIEAQKPVQTPLQAQRHGGLPSLPTLSLAALVLAIASAAVFLAMR